MNKNKSLTPEQLKNRKLYYQGYQQCFVDILNIFKEQKEVASERIYLDLNKFEELAASLSFRIQTTFKRGYMYYDEVQKKFVYEEKEFE